MRITYLLPRPELGGGLKVIYQHAALLAGLGEEVTLLGEGRAPEWLGELAGGLPYHDYSAGPPRLPEQDLVIATFWTTIDLARRLDLGPVAHFCQGYEGGLIHLRPVLPQIEAAYSQPLPAITVSPHLGEFLRRRFGRPSVVVPPPLDPLFRPARWPCWPRWRAGRRPWIVIPGIFEAEVKGVATALDAVRRLRAAGLACRVVRTTMLPLSAEERELLAPDRYLCGVSRAEIAATLRHGDLLLFPSRAEEGFGLPLLEAMASRLPAVASRIPSTEASTQGAVVLVPVGDGAAMAAAAHELLTVPRAWRQARRRGFQAAQSFRPEAVAPQLAAAVRWLHEQVAGASGGAPEYGSL